MEEIEADEVQGRADGGDGAQEVVGAREQL